MLPQTGKKLTKKRGSKFGALLWRHLTPKRKTAICALQSILYTTAQKGFGKFTSHVTFGAHNLCSFRAVSGLPIPNLTLAVSAM